jgi:hypothetical protein
MQPLLLEAIRKARHLRRLKVTYSLTLVVLENINSSAEAVVLAERARRSLMLMLGKALNVV